MAALINQDYSTLLNEVNDKLKLVNKLYFKNTANTTRDYTKENVLGGSTAVPDSKSVIQQLLALKNTTANLPLQNFISPTTDFDNVHIGTYIPSYSGGIEVDYNNQLIANLDTTDSNINEINCLCLLDYSKDTFTPSTKNASVSVLHNSSTNSIYTFMQGLYTLYNMFEASTWETYKNSIQTNNPTSMSFCIPTVIKSQNSNFITNNSNYAVLIDSTNFIKYINYVSPTLLETILLSKKFNPFVARRLIFLWIVLSNYLIISVYFTKNPSNQSKIAPILSSIYNLFARINKSVSYNSIEDTDINIDASQITNSQMTLETNTLEAQLYKWAVTFIQTNTNDNKINPYANYNLITSNNNAYIIQQYNAFLNSTNNLNNSTYSFLVGLSKEAITNKQTEIINNVTTNLKELTINSKHTDVKTFLSESKKNEINSQNSIFNKQVTNQTVINERNQAYINAIYSNTNGLRQMSSSTGVFGDINNAIGEYISYYTNGQDQINDISGLLNKGKANLKTIQELLNGRLSIQKTQRIFEYIAIFIFVLFIITTMTIIVIKVDKNIKLNTCIGLIIFSLLNFLGIQILLNSSIFVVKSTPKPVIEGFAPPIMSSISIGNANYLNYYNIAMIDQVSLYLDNTFTLVTLLETYRVYGNVNASLEKEIGYYTNIVSQLNNAQSKINNVYFSSYINTIDISALLQLFQILTIIIATACTSYILTEDMEIPSIRNWIGGITATLAVFAFIIYIFEISKRVHTNPVKVYWYQPDANTFSSK